MDLHLSWKTFLLYILCLIVLLLLVKYLQIRNNYSPIFTWWNSYGGEKYNKYFNVFAVMSSYDSYIFYLLSSLFGTLQNQVNRDQIDFLVDNIFPLTRTPGIQKMSQFVLPRHISESITFAVSDGDRYFSSWVKSNNRNDLVPLVFNKTNTDYKYDESIQPVGNPLYENQIGVYPTVNDKVSWRLLFQMWGAHKWEQDKGGIWIAQMDEDSTVEWMNINIHPDNFLARYGILPDCPMITAFVNGKYNDPSSSVVFDTQAFANLIGGETPGGWIGFLHGAGKMTVDEYKDYLYSVYIGKPTVKGEAPLCTTGKTATNWISGITSGIGAGIAPWFLVSAATGPLGIAAAAFGSLVLAGGTAYASISNSQRKCG